MIQTRSLLPKNGEDLERLVGISSAMQSVIAAIRMAAAASTTSVVITGESGTGKELVARNIHHLSARAAGPYVGLNCAAIPETLIESELFGHERGAFTGAEQSRAGCFETAQGGTLLLDEISEMNLGLQSKLLRVLEERRVRRLGGSAGIELDIRVLAASNRNLLQAVQEGRFRGDLFYRLHVFPIHVPPLRERPEDLPLLVEAFVTHYAALNHKPVHGISIDCARTLEAYSWPGNVRQLRNVLERAVIMCSGQIIEKSDLPEEFHSISPVQEGCFRIRVGTPLRDIEKQAILRTLELTQGNNTRAAQLLGITSRTLYNKLKRYR